MSEPHPPNRATRRRARSKDQKRVPLNLRVTPRMREDLDEVAGNTGRSLSQQTEFLLEQALLVFHPRSWFGATEGGEEAPPRVVEEIYRAPQPPSDELIGRFIRLEADIAGLRAAVEKGLDRNTAVISHVEARLNRRVAEFEAKITTDATEVAIAVNHLQTVTACLLAALRALDVELTERRREAAGAPHRARVVPKAG
jgi:hypothetical protein